MKWSVLIIPILFLACLFGPSAVKSYFVNKAPKPEVIHLNADKLFSVVNEWRVEAGYKPYEKSEGLCKIAENRSNDGIDYHKGLYDKFGSYQSVIQENSNQRAETETASLHAWLNSPPHFATLKKDYKYSCVATKGDFAVQIFSNCENGCP